MTNSRPSTSPAPPSAEDVRVGPGWVRLLPWLIAGVLALLAAGLTVKNLRLRREHAHLQAERDLAQTAYQMMSNQLDERTLLAERMITDFGRRLQRQEDLARLQVSRLMPMTAEPKAQGIIVWDPARNAGLLVVEDLSPLPAGAEYSLCVLDPSGNSQLRLARVVPGPGGDATVPFKVEGPSGAESRFAVTVEQPHPGRETVDRVVLRSP